MEIVACDLESLVLRPSRCSSDYDEEPELQRLARVLPHEATKVATCGATGRGLRRCKSRACRACETIARRSFVRRADRLLSAARSGGSTCGLLTLSLGAPTVSGGRRDLLRALGGFRRPTAEWRRVVLVEPIAIEVERCVGIRASAARWNVHLHAGIALDPRRRSIADLRSAFASRWRAEVGRGGSSDFRAPWVGSPDWRGQGDGLGAYCGKPWRCSLAVEGLTDDEVAEEHEALAGKRLRWTNNRMPR